MASSLARPAVFLDRDGTINWDHGYVHRADQFEFIPGAPAAIRSLNAMGYLVLVVTNQAGVARGYYSEIDVRRLHAHVDRELAAQGARVDAYYHCPFHPTHGLGRYRRTSSCRKPGTGMFTRACRDFHVDVPRSWMVGDSESDMEFSRRAGLRGIRVGVGGWDLRAAARHLARCDSLRSRQTPRAPVAL